jgi:prepilin-type N-terminal cleavage/methylation domain-containing protein
MRARPIPNDSNEAGLTLIELLVVCVLLGIIAIAFSTSIVVGLTSFFGTDNRVRSTTDAQLLSLYLPADLQSASGAAGNVIVEGANTQSTPGGAFVTQTGNTECSGVPNLLVLKWTDDIPGNNDPAYMAAYALSQVGARWQLKRYYCPYQAPTQIQRLVGNLNGNGLADARVDVSGSKVTMQLRDRAVPRGDPLNYQYTISGYLRSAA